MKLYPYKSPEYTAIELRLDTILTGKWLPEPIVNFEDMRCLVLKERFYVDSEEALNYIRTISEHFSQQQFYAFNKFSYWELPMMVMEQEDDYHDFRKTLETKETITGHEVGDYLDSIALFIFDDSLQWLILNTEFDGCFIFFKNEDRALFDGILKSLPNHDYVFYFKNYIGTFFDKPYYKKLFQNYFSKSLLDEPEPDIDKLIKSRVERKKEEQMEMEKRSKPVKISWTYLNEYRKKIMITPTIVSLFMLVYLLINEFCFKEQLYRHPSGLQIFIIGTSPFIVLAMALYYKKEIRTIQALILFIVCIIQFAYLVLHLVYEYRFK